MSRSTPILGFKPPYLRDAEIVLPVLTGCGVDGELTATPAVWRRIFDALEPHLPVRTRVVVVDTLAEARRQQRTPRLARIVRLPIQKPSGGLL